MSLDGYDELVKQGRRLLKLMDVTDAVSSTMHWLEVVEDWLNQHFPNTGLAAKWIAYGGFDQILEDMEQGETRQDWKDFKGEVDVHLMWLSELPQNPIVKEFQHRDKNSSGDNMRNAFSQEKQRTNDKGAEFNIFGGQPRVFIVHGHDKATLDSVELLLHRIGADPVTYKRIPKKGSPTIIEVLEQNVPTADAILVLMTPDDEGRKRGLDEDSKPRALKPRARENVVAEAGYALISARNKALILALGGVSIPSDFDGIDRVQRETFDKEGELKVAQRLKQIGLNVEVSQV